MDVAPLQRTSIMTPTYKNASLQRTLARVLNYRAEGHPDWPMRRGDECTGGMLASGVMVVDMSTKSAVNGTSSLNGGCVLTVEKTDAFTSLLTTPDRRVCRP